MTPSFATTSRSQTRGHIGTGQTLAMAIVAGSIVLGLLFAAATFAGLAIGFPIAGTIAAQYQVPVSARDLQIAEQFSHFWWVFAALSVATLVAAWAVFVKTASTLEARRAR